LTLVFLPFTTALLAEYVTTDYAQPAVVFYSFGYLLHNVGWNLLYESILKPKVLLKEMTSMGNVKSLRRGARYGFIVYLSTTILAWWFPLTALTICTLLYILWVRMSIIKK
jgi:uncharacterized membrane protein